MYLEGRSRTLSRFFQRDFGMRKGWSVEEGSVESCVEADLDGTTSSIRAVAFASETQTVSRSKREATSKGTSDIRSKATSRRRSCVIESSHHSIGSGSRSNVVADARRCCGEGESSKNHSVPTGGPSGGSKSEGLGSYRMRWQPWDLQRIQRCRLYTPH